MSQMSRAYPDDFQQRLDAGQMTPRYSALTPKEVMCECCGKQPVEKDSNGKPVEDGLCRHCWLDWQRMRAAEELREMEEDQVAFQAIGRGQGRYWGVMS